MFPRDTLGAWATLPFFRDDLPRIEDALARETRTILPPPTQVFKALELVQPDDVRVIILGQDPYHTPRKAHGLAFSITDEFDGRLDSLGNIFKELKSDINVVRTRTQLDDWAAQGVLLLNTILTVPQGQPKGHAKLEWQTLTAQILARLDSEPRAFLLWGAPAQLAARKVDPASHFKLETPHPSPLSAHRGFLGSRPFSRCNAWLRARGHASINWGDPEGL
jgi:uracil-DNA glycosylase